MRKIQLIITLLIPVLILSYIWFGDSIIYSKEIKIAYDYVHPRSQKTIKNWKLAQVTSYTPTGDTEIKNNKTDKYVNVQGKELVIVSFKTHDEEITVFIDKNTNEVLGNGMKK
ncbi:hypothetical protein ACFFJY_02830 [Fictibacillus aquaticus]|uniref:DUF3139 domain-containing protein n=1 Tax=Fictibacillus aquaticus TaxID=2021314 RepID=A0A235FA80_9BACL|nr:hypothetical protein [Fictibacillus aquaticus]OYD57635.1 hypothetical protein CGZ90_13295 [Fictibacillus aquaticus]